MIPEMFVAELRTTYVCAKNQEQLLAYHGYRVKISASGSLQL